MFTERIIANLAKRYYGLPGPPANAAEQLERGKKRIELLRAELEALDSQLAECPEAKVRRERQALEAADRGRSSVVGPPEAQAWQP